MHPTASFFRHHPQSIAAVTVGVLGLAAYTAYLKLRKTVSPEEREERRRTWLAENGRIIDGTLIDTAPHLDAFEGR